MPVTLDRTRVIALVHEHNPDVLIAQARIHEAQAQHVGARVFAQTNPDISVIAGPRFIPGVTNTTIVPDVTVSLAWPIDLSGTRDLRGGLADQMTRVAVADAADVQRNVLAETLDLFVRTLGAGERVRLESARAGLDTSLVGIARTRRNAGATGDEEIELAEIIQGQGLARLHAAEGERDALLAQLRSRLGLGHDVPVNLSGELLPTEPFPLSVLLARLSGRTDVTRAFAATSAARIDARLQNRLGLPVPHAMIQGGHDPEYSVHAGFGLPLPVYQRNQTNAAVAQARVATHEVEQLGVLRRAEAELRASYAVYLASRAAFHAIDTTTSAAADAEQLAMRSYQLGQSGLEHVVIVRRETAAARSAWLDALITLARARLAVDHAAGVLQ